MIYNKQISRVDVRKVSVGYCSILSALVHRNGLNSLRNPMLSQTKLIQGVFLSLFYGGMYFKMGSNTYLDFAKFTYVCGLSFALTTAFMMAALLPIILTFPQERDIFFKEKDAKMYNTTQYFFARNIVEFP